MNRNTIARALTLAAAALLFAAAAGFADDTPLKWPASPFGKDDQVGAANYITPDKTLAAAKLVKRGKTATLGKVYQAGIPAFGLRSWNLHIPGKPTGGPFGVGHNDIVYNDDILTTEIGQIGTQFDGLGHIGVRTSKGDYFYNGHFLENFFDQYGLRKVGVEHVAEKGFASRGVLIDVAGYRGVDRLPIPKGGKGDPGIITVEDLVGALKKQGVREPGEGDIVLIHTGHGKYWGRDWDKLTPQQQAENKTKFNSGEPGPGITACRWLTSKKISLVGSDTWATEAVPGEDLNRPFDCHIEWMTRTGTFNIENLDLSQLVEDKAYEFLFVWSPLKIKGGTGSPGNPMALY
jgi:kynurenine formamidase